MNIKAVFGGIFIAFSMFSNVVYSCDYNKFDEPYFDSLNIREYIFKDPIYLGTDVDFVDVNDLAMIVDQASVILYSSDGVNFVSQEMLYKYFLNAAENISSRFYKSEDFSHLKNIEKQIFSQKLVPGKKAKLNTFIRKNLEFQKMYAEAIGEEKINIFDRWSDYGREYFLELINEYMTLTQNDNLIVREQAKATYSEKRGSREYPALLLGESVPVDIPSYACIDENVSSFISLHISQPWIYIDFLKASTSKNVGLYSIAVSKHVQSSRYTNGIFPQEALSWLPFELVIEVQKDVGWLLRAIRSKNVSWQ